MMLPCSIRPMDGLPAASVDRTSVAVFDDRMNTDSWRGGTKTRAIVLLLVLVSSSMSCVFPRAMFQHERSTATTAPPNSSSSTGNTGWTNARLSCARMLLSVGIPSITGMNCMSQASTRVVPGSATMHPKASASKPFRKPSFVNS